MSETLHACQIITPYAAHQKHKSPFHAVHRYESSHITLEVRYGDEDFLFQTFLYNDPVKYNICDILEAAGNKNAKAQPVKLCVTTAMLEKEIRKTAQIWQTYHNLITSPSAEILKIANEIKEMRLKETFLVARQEQLEAASIKAARAFLKEDYKAVIYWLRPYQSSLDKNDLKKLELAKRRFLQFL